MKKHEVDMTSGNLFYKIFIVSLPLMLSGVLQLFYNAADLIVCGKFGSEHSVAAISATNSLINLIVQIFLGFSVGASVVMARAFGSKDNEKSQRVVHSSMLLSLIVGIIIGLFGFFFAHRFLSLMETPDDVINLSSQYLKIYFIGLPFSMIYNFGASLLRATGDTKHPFYYLSLAGIANILLNLFFVIICHLDVAGVALGTIVSQAISAILVVRCLYKNNGFCKLEFSKLKFSKQEVKEIIFVGFPAGLQGAIFSLSNVLIQSSVNSLGTAIMDGNGAATSLEGFVYTCMNAIAQTSIAFISANYGAKNIKNIHRSVLYSVLLVMIFGTVIGGAVTIFGKQLLTLYINNPVAINEGYERLKIICLTYTLCGLMDVFAFSLRGIGYSLLPTLVTLAGACGIRVLWVYTVFASPAYHNLKWLSISYPASWLITASIHLGLFLILKAHRFKLLDDNYSKKSINYSKI